MKLKSLLIIFDCFLLINCLKEENTDVTVNLYGLYDEHIGKKGTVVIVCTPALDFPIVDTSKTVRFQLSITNGKNYLSVGCGFFKTEREDLYVFCNVDETIPAGNYTFDLDGIQPITYEGYTVTLAHKTDLQFTKYDTNMNDLYSDKQTINIVEGKETYEIRFKISSYNQDPIFANYFLFINCSQKNDELVCNFTRKLLDALIVESDAELSICYMSNIAEGKKFPLIPKINVKYGTIQKTDVFVGITKLLEGVSEHDTLIAYETNVTDIDNVFMDLYEGFELEFINMTKTTSQRCAFRKYDDNPLLILCFFNNEGENWLKEITQEKVYNDLNVKYNFRIQPSNNEEKIIEKTYPGSFILRVYPEILDFSKSDSLTIDYGMKDPTSLRRLTFNENAGDLSCKTIGTEIKRCTVPKSHFEGKQSGYYFIKHENHLGGRSTCYEGIPIKAILNDPPSPTDDPTDEPTDEPTDKPTDKPTDEPTDKPTDEPTDKPTDKPTDNSEGNMNSFVLAYSLILILFI